MALHLKELVGDVHPELLEGVQHAGLGLVLPQKEVLEQLNLLLGGDEVPLQVLLESPAVPDGVLGSDLLLQHKRRPYISIEMYGRSYILAHDRTSLPR